MEDVLDYIRHLLPEIRLIILAKLDVTLLKGSGNYF